MATTLGSLAIQILNDTNRDAGAFLNPGNPQTYQDAVQNAIVTAIKYLEYDYYWLFKKLNTITILQNSNVTALPVDFGMLINAGYSLNGGLYNQRQGFLPMPYDELTSLFWNTSSTGYPTKYSILANNFYVFPYCSANTVFNLTYYYKDVTYPVNPEDTSIWFNDLTVDLVRMIAMQRFYKDTLQTPEIADTYDKDIAMFQAGLMRQNNNRQVSNVMSI
jgi:hypothetical protein